MSPQARAGLRRLASSAPVVVFSFSDCPWCVAAKATLEGCALTGTAEPAVYEIDEMGREGKVLRAALAEATGRTSMPNVFVGGRSIGGFTDGYEDRPAADGPSVTSGLGRDCEWVWPGSPGLEALHESGRLRGMLQAASCNLGGL